MRELSSLVEQSCEGDLNAFTEVVRRFQHMAHGYAYSILGDFHLAEDAAQEAFVDAYLRLNALREPAAFPGWFRRIVFKHCDRFMRRKQVGTVPLEEGMQVPQARPVRSELQDKVLNAVRELPERQREATTLFYINGYSQIEIADFLEVPVSTVRKRLQYSRKKLKERMIDMVEETLKANAPAPRFREQILERLQHWDRFKGDTEEKIAMVSSDAEWSRLLEMEARLAPISEEACAIRTQIACLEACHEHYLLNVDAILQMIGETCAGRIRDCGVASASRQEEARVLCKALESWLSGGELSGDCSDETREVFALLGELTETKSKLVRHLIRKLQDNSYEPYAPEDEDFQATESRINHLEICNYNWRKNVRILLEEMGAGKRLAEWHTHDGFNTCGDCPDRLADLLDTMAMAAAWCDEEMDKAGRPGSLLGQPSPEKRWLVASLCKHVATQHAHCDPGKSLAVPTVC